MSSQIAIVDSETPENVPLCAKYLRSFAYLSMKDRLPVILTKAIDNLARDKENIISCFGEASRDEVKKVIGYISQLKNELQTDKPFTILSSTGPDAEIWNNFLTTKIETTGLIPSYFQTEWFYAECYVYRRLREAFLLTNTIVNLDPFHRLKRQSLEESLLHLESLLSAENAMITKQLEEREKASKFFYYLKSSLWGNKCDLSLSAGKPVAASDNPLRHLEELDSFILVDESKTIWDVVKKSESNTVDIILDNAGFELVTDLCLAEYLIKVCNVKKVRFRVKAIPWFVSDVMEKDFHYVVNTISEFDEPFSGAASRWLDYIEKGLFEIKVDNFWTLPYSCKEMKDVDRKLYDELSESILVIFKGDLNFRKLVADINTPFTQSIDSAVGSFHPTNIAILRTLKSDTVCSLPAGIAEKAAKRSSKWLVSGDFGTILFSPAPSSNE